MLRTYQAAVHLIRENCMYIHIRIATKQWCDKTVSYSYLIFAWWTNMCMWTYDYCYVVHK